MSRLVYSWGTVVLFFTACALFVYLVINIDSLHRSVSNLRTQEKVSRNEIGLLKSERETLLQSTSSLKRGSIDLSNAITGSADYIRAVAKPLDKSCLPTDKRRCDFFIRYGRVVISRQKALAARVFASNDQDYRALIGLYQDLIDANDQVGWTSSSDKKSFHAAGLEGLAYANLKLGSLDQADRYSQLALAEAPESALPNLTMLKIMCARGESRQKVLSARANAIERFDRRLASAHSEGDAAGVRNATIGKDHFLNDPELKHLCAI